ncbi:MAG: hypothetical protein KBS55_03615 [Bacteroidales bacterium]|nr:hypothetical protein [Candidatus Cryptobacteroides aphodequi]
MKENRLASKIVIAAASVLAAGGAVLSVIQLVNSLRYGFDYYTFIPAVLYIICFADLAIYAFSGIIKSGTAFKFVLLSYAFVVIVTGLLMPPVFPQGTKFIFMALSALVVAGLAGFNFLWYKVVLSKVFLTFAYFAELAYAYGALTGNPMAMEGDIVAQLSVFIRPILLSTMAVCYLARMYEKAHEAKTE